MIWLIGNRGMLGQEIGKLLERYNIEYCVSSSEVDITNFKDIESFGREKNIKWIINCAGYTQVDKAELEPEKAFRINKDGVKNIALFSAEREINLIHFSTDYIFDGRFEKDAMAYKEEDKPNPINIYGESKLAGEEEIKRIFDHYYIIRTAWLYGKNGRNFASNLLRLLQEREEISLVSDQWSSPTYAVDLAAVILKIITDNSNKFGIYHFTNEGISNWYKFAEELYKKSRFLGIVDYRKKIKIIPIKTRELNSLADRPRWSVLNKEKIKKELNLEIRYWEEALTDFLKP
ncbi:MAG: dTDP-4-dehydrorhamnose reductase [Candidatus Caldatribacteriota bacterium]